MSPLFSRFFRDRRSARARLKRLGFSNALFLIFFVVFFPIYPVFGFVLYDGSRRTLADIDTTTIISTEEDISPADMALARDFSPRARDWAGRRTVQMYVVQEGDTIGQLSRDFGLSLDTLHWANNSLAILRAGDSLLIPPADGIVYVAQAGDTLDSIAKKFRLPIEKIRTNNTLTGDAVAGVTLFLPGAEPLVKPKIVKDIAPKNQKNEFTLELLNPSGGSFVPGQCTYFVAKYWPVKWKGHARYWFKNAANAGYRTGQIAKSGAIVVWYGPGYNLSYGHVAIVMSVNVKAGTMIVRDMNYAGPWKVTTRTEKIHNKYIVGFIYNEKK